MNLSPIKNLNLTEQPVPEHLTVKVNLIEQDVAHILEPVAEHLLAAKVGRNLAQEVLLNSARRALRLVADDHRQPLSVAAEQAERVVQTLIPDDVYSLTE